MSVPMLPKLDFNIWNQRNNTTNFPSFIQEEQIEESAVKLSENKNMANYLNDEVPNYSQRPSQMSKRTTDQIITGRLS